MSLLAAIHRKGREHGRGAIGQRQQIGSRTTIPAPTRGLNTRDAFAAMKADYAIKLDNFFPDHGAVRLRRGYMGFANGMGSNYVESLIPHYSGSTTKLYAVGGGSLYDITDGGEVGSALTSGLSSNIMSFATVSGSTIIVNSADEPMRIEPAGTLAADHNWVATGEDALPTFRRVMVFKNRLYFIEQDAAKVWYGGLLNVQGPLSAFDFSFIAPEGGNVLEIGTMTVDAGAGIDDLFLVFMQYGVVLVYNGIDPSASDETGFSLVGKFTIGSLVGDRPLVNVGGDLIALTVDGAVPLGELLKRGRSGQRRLALTDAIAPTIRDQATLYGSLTGWDSILHPPASWLLFNVPGGRQQYVMNTQNGAWCRFVGMDARCWGRFDDRLYFGGPNGGVFRADAGKNDNGSPIEGDVQTAYNYFGTPQDKRITMSRSVVESDANVSFQLGSTTDFGVSPDLAAPSTLASSGTPWATATKETGRKWATATKETGNRWGAGRVQLRTWQKVNQIGAALSVRLRSSTQEAELALFATDVIYEKAPSLL